MAHSTHFEKLNQGNENDFHTVSYFIQLVKKQLSTMGKVLWGITEFVLSQLTMCVLGGVGIVRVDGETGWAESHDVAV